MAKSDTIETPNRVQVPCPTCESIVEALPPENPSFPFCGDRCKMIDLGRWLNGEYAIDPSTGKLDHIDPDEAVDVTEDFERMRRG